MTLRDLLNKCSYKKTFNRIYKFYLKNERTEAEIIKIDSAYFSFFESLKQLPKSKSSVNKIHVSATSDPEQIRSADAMIFPGQGANDSSMRPLRSSGLVDPIKEFVQNGKLFLGICLGLQLILEGSDEGVEPGLGLVDGWVRHLPAGHKIPHMGWNTVNFRIDHPIFSGIPENSYFYFVHSYYADPEDKTLVSGTTMYGVDFCSAIASYNLVAVQFHPEKSGDTGLILYRNFVDLMQKG